MKKKIIVGISGASGVIYGIRLLAHLKHLDVERHLILSDAAKKNIRIETRIDPQEVKSMADFAYDESEIAAGPASGSFPAHGMVVVPCSIKTLSGIVNSYSSNLLIRTADVTLKEKRKLVLVVRETPLHKGHLDLMTRAADYGALILPPVPAFYHFPQTIDDLIDQTLGKILDCFGLSHDLFHRWKGENHAV